MSTTRIVFVTRLSAIGDVIMTSRALQLLFANGYFPILVTSESTKEIAQFVPQLTSVITIEKNQPPKYFNKSLQTLESNVFAQHLASVKAEKAPIFLDLQKTSRSKRARKILSKSYYFEKTYTVPKRTLWRIFLIFLSYLFFSQRKKSKKLDVQKIENIKNIHEDIIIKIVKQDGKLFNSTYSHEFLPLVQTVKLNTPPYLCIFPGASSFIKMWPKENYQSLIKLILEKTNLNIVLLGGQEEVWLGEFFDFPKNTRVQNAICQTNLTETLNYIAHSKYVVTNDSFPVHAAEAFRIPATVFFGSTSPQFGFAPKAQSISIEYANLACSPCTRHGKRECRFRNLKCLTSLTAEDVIKNIMQKTQHS